MKRAMAIDADGAARLLAEAACRGAAALLRLCKVRDAKVKQDGSPVCSADLAADRAVKAALAESMPDVCIVSEETADESRPGAEFILVDPLDGTREFLADGDSYCVAVALVRDRRPVAGAIAAPLLGRLWFAGSEAFGQSLDHDGNPAGEPRRIHVRPVPGNGPTALVSRFHGDQLSDGVAARLGAPTRRPMSSAVKFGLIAEGEADLHVQAGQTMEWDIAAGDAILSAAGGMVLTLAGERPRYGCIERGFTATPSFVAAGSEALAREAVAAAAQAA